MNGPDVFRDREAGRVFPKTGVAVGVTILLLAGCGGSNEAPISDPTGGAAEASEQVEPENLGDSPLNDLLGIPITDETAMVEYEKQLQRDVQRSISECMLVEGFDYQPVDPSQFAPDAATASDSRESAAARGFGMAVLVDEMQTQVSTSFNDPNDKIRAGLSPAETDAYDRALYGESSDDVDGFEEPQGCYGAGLDQAYSVIAVLDSFGSQIDELFQQFTSDPRIVAIDASWSRCMGDAGFNFASMNDIRADFAARVSAIAGSAESFVDPEAAPSSMLEFEEDGVVVVVMGGSTLTEGAQAKLDLVSAEERNAAVASWDCAEPNRDAQADILLEYEQQFVAENGERIKELLPDQE